VAAIPVPACPGWSVTDLAAHVYGVPRDVADGNVAEDGTPGWTGAQVERFAPKGLTAPVSGWNEVAPAFHATIGGGSRRVRLETDSFTLHRVLTGRRSLGQIRALPWEGDPEPYLAVFDGSPLTPAAYDIVE